MLTFIVFCFYSLVAFGLTCVVVARMVKHEGPRQPLQVLCRIGILFLTIGTVLDNARTAAGTLLDDGPGAFIWLNVGVSWFCIEPPSPRIYMRLDTGILRDSVGGKEWWEKNSYTVHDIRCSRYHAWFIHFPDNKIFISTAKPSSN